MTAMQAYPKSTASLFLVIGAVLSQVVEAVSAVKIYEIDAMVCAEEKELIHARCFAALSQCPGLEEYMEAIEDVR